MNGLKYYEPDPEKTGEAIPPEEDATSSGSVGGSADPDAPEPPPPNEPEEPVSAEEGLAEEPPAEPDEE